MGIERGIERKQKETNKEVNEVSFCVYGGGVVIPRRASELSEQPF